MLDSTAKIPDALLDLHHIFLGNIEECIDISVSPRQVGNESLPGFNGKYRFSTIAPNDQVINCNLHSLNNAFITMFYRNWV